MYSIVRNLLMFAMFMKILSNVTLNFGHGVVNVRGDNEELHKRYDKSLFDTLPKHKKKQLRKQKNEKRKMVKMHAAMILESIIGVQLSHPLLQFSLATS